MLFEIMNDIAARFRSGLTGIIDTGRGRIMRHCVASDNMNQQFFKIQSQKLLCAKRNIVFFFHFFQIRIIERRNKTVSENSRTLFSKKFMQGESQEKEITMMFGAVLPAAFSV